eukprot:4585523-Prorocentrum_lima.AAC.1
MTSSLVGSEMCIRDRLKQQQSGAKSLSSAELEEMEHQFVQLGQEVEKPVSYTHLTLPTICSV